MAERNMLGCCFDTEGVNIEAVPLSLPWIFPQDKVVSKAVLLYVYWNCCALIVHCFMDLFFELFKRVHSETLFEKHF